MKTNKEWYEQHLPKEIAEKAVKAASEQGVLLKTSPTIKDAIDFFEWECADGFIFWQPYFEMARDGKFDKPINQTPSIQDTINILMEYAATKGCKAVVTFEPLNSTNDKV
jgi:hypothetical protein